jgi:3-hydroxyisobutyrate dehydrogenase
VPPSEFFPPVGGEKTADFQLQLMLKDLNLMGRMAMDAGAPMLISNTVRNLFQAGVNNLGGTNNPGCNR